MKVTTYIALYYYASGIINTAARIYRNQRQPELLRESYQRLIKLHRISFVLIYSWCALNHQSTLRSD